MKDKLRDLAARWSAKDPVCEAGVIAIITITMSQCAAELLAILDAEGDGGAVPATFCIYMTKGGLYGYRESKDEADKFVAETNATRTDIQVYALPAYTHPARSGVVSESVNAVVNGLFEGLISRQLTSDEVRAALEEYERNRK